VRSVSKYSISKPIRTGLKAVQTLNHWYTIFWETITLIKGKYIQIPVFDNSSRMAKFLHMKTFLLQSKQFSMCTKSISAYQNWKKNTQSIVLKTHGAKHRMWGKYFASKHRKSQFDMNMSVVLKSTQKLLFISNFLDNTRKMVAKNQEEKLYTVFCFSCKITKSEVTRIWLHNDDIWNLSIR